MGSLARHRERRVGITTGHEQQRLAREALDESPVIFREMIAFLIRDGFTLQCVESVGEVPTQENLAGVKDKHDANSMHGVFASALDGEYHTKQRSK